MPSGIFDDDLSGPFAWLLKVGSWKLTEIKLAKKKIEASSDTSGERRKEREISGSTVGWR